MNKLNQFITQLKLNNSRDYKIGILKAWKSEIMNKDSIISLILRYVYSYDIQFYITSDSILKHWNDELQNIVTINTLPNLLDFLQETRGLCAVYSAIDFIKRHIEYKDLILSILDKKLNVGITETTINKVYPNFIKTFDVCLAQKYDSKSKIDENWIIERKLDGCRTIVIKKDNQIKIYSRQGKEFTTLDKIKEDLLDLPNNTVLDGEVCILDKDGNEDFQSIIRVIKRKDFTIKNPVLKVFDILTLDEFETGKGNTVYTDRINRLSEWFKQHKTKTIQFVKYWNYTEDNFQMLKNIVTENNWEGLMLRKNIGYQNGRIKDLLKYKMFQSEEFTVIDTKEGVITIVEDGVSKQIKTLGSVIIKLDDNNTCDVGSGFTIEERNQFYNNPELIVGQQIEVKYFEKTVDQEGKLSLRFPVFKCLRPEII